MKNKDEVNARVTKQAIEAKLPYMLQFLANADDDVSGTIAPFAHDYVTMLKQTVPLSDQQKEFVKVQYTNYLFTTKINVPFNNVSTSSLWCFSGPEEDLRLELKMS